MSFAHAAPVDDAPLVRRACEGDQGAWSEIYDRYADRLYTYCRAILHDDHEAEDTVHDAFVTAAGRLGQLRDPSRLRPWLYAICRSGALARARKRKRSVPTENVIDLTATVPEPTGPEQAELALLVRDAAEGLSPRDQTVLELHLRHGFDGADLGEALGVSPQHASVLLSRVRDQVERSLGALLVARTGRRECADLDGLLRSWQGSLTPVIRKRVARHIERCPNCGERRRRMVSPMALLAATPPLLAPAALRSRILESVKAASASPPENDAERDDHGKDNGGGSGRGRGRAVIAAGAALVVLGIWLASGHGDTDGATVVTGADGAATSSAAGVGPPPAPSAGAGQPPAGPSETSPGATASPTPPAGTGPTPPGPAGTAVPTTVTAVTTENGVPAPGPPVVGLPISTVDFGSAATSAELRFTNKGGQGLAWTITSGHAAVTVSPSTGTLTPGAEAVVKVLLDREKAEEGSFSTQLVVGGSGVRDGAGATPVTVAVKAAVAHPPELRSLATDRPRLRPGSPECDSTRARAVVVDESAVKVVLTWRQGPLAPTEVEMVPDRSGTFIAIIGPVLTLSAGDVVWSVFATDALGNHTTSPDRVLPVTTTC